MRASHLALFDALGSRDEPGDLGSEVLGPLEAFLIKELGDAGVWRGRESDGVSWARCKVADGSSVRVCGEVWEVADQSLHAFWLDLARNQGSVTSWRLYYDLDEAQMKSRSARDALYVIVDPDDVPWKARVSGVHGKPTKVE